MAGTGEPGCCDLAGMCHEDMVMANMAHMAMAIEIYIYIVGLSINNDGDLP